MAKLFDRVGQATATTGTGTLTLGAVITDSTNGDLATFADMGAVAGDYVNYTIIDGNNFEIGFGLLGGTGPGFTLTRIVSRSKSSGAMGTTPLTLSGAAKVYSNPTQDDYTLTAPLKSGKWYAGYMRGKISQQATCDTANQLNAHAIQIKAKTTIQALGCRITTATTGNIRFAIYDTDPTTGHPGKLLAITNPAAFGGAGGSFSIALTSNITLLPGTYWLAGLSDVAITAYSTSGDNNEGADTVGCDAAAYPMWGNSGGSFSGLGIGTYTYGAFPSTFNVGGTKTISSNEALVLWLSFQVA